MKWFWADTHLQHDAILDITFRPWATPAEHDAAVLKAINKHVDVNDELFLLGDVAWYGWDRSWINCKRAHLIWGNHDRAKFGREFTTDNDVLDVKIMGDQLVFLSHYCHCYWPASHRNAMHLYGHNHAQREAYLDAIWPDRRSMDIGVDNSQRLLDEIRPFNELDIIRILGPRDGHDPVSFYEDYRNGGRHR